MTGPSSTPRGEHPGRPGTRWQTHLVTSGEQLVHDNTPTPRPNRATRRAAMRAGRPPFSKEQHMADTDRPRTFGLIRQHDVTGVSGTGRVAEGVQWPDGTVSVRWRGPRPSIVHWGGLADVEAVHGHGGHTHIAWDDQQQTDDPAAAHAVVDTVTREQLHHAIRTLAQRDPQWWHRELERMALVEGRASLLKGHR